jgi:hypothetical protein
MKTLIRKAGSLTAIVAGLFAVLATPAFADGGYSPYQPHVPVDTAFAGSDIAFIGGMLMIVIGAAVVSYSRNLKSKIA